MSLELHALAVTYRYIAGVGNVVTLVVEMDKVIVRFIMSNMGYSSVTSAYMHHYVVYYGHILCTNLPTYSLI